MLTFDVKDKEIAQRLLKNVQLIRFAESLGGTETLLTYPITQTHADVPKDVWKRMKLPKGHSVCQWESRM